MKKTMYALGILAASALMSAETRAQGLAAPFDYSYSTAPYTYLDNSSTLILGNTGWDDTSVVFSLPAGFNFKYQDVAVTDWRMDTYGGLYPNELSMDLELPAIIGVQSDYLDNGNSRISYTVSGTTGSRIAKVEFRNLGFYDGAASDTANFQIWLYEGSNKIEYHVGPNNTAEGMFNPESGSNYLMTGLMCEIAGSSDIIIQAVNYNNGANTDTTLMLDPAGPSMEQGLAILYSITDFPVNGAVFTFAPKTVTSVKNLATRISTVSPNPATDKVTLQLKNTPPADAQVVVYTITGQKVYGQKVSGVNTEIALNNLTKGVYLLSYYAGGEKETLRLIKK
jgi:hypothetical protein